MSAPTPIHQPPAADRHEGRLVFVWAFAVVWFVGVVARLYWLQVENYEGYVQKAEEQQRRVVVLDAPRGTIFDARGRELAVSVEAFSVAVHPPAVSDKETAATALASALDRDREWLLEKLSSRRGFVWLERKVDDDRARRVRELDIHGVELLPESKREYPLGTLAAQVLGYVGTDNHGLSGLEYRFEKAVANEKGRRTVLLDGLNGRLVSPTFERSDPRPGKDLHLTLDVGLQYIVERELERAVEDGGATSGMVVMQDPKTGAVLAMASYPGFDPNDFSKADPEHQKNKPVSDAFEPGSTFKMVTLAAALEANAVDPLQVFFCGQGGITLAGRRINDHTPFGDLTVREIMAKSSNVGAIKLGAAAGRERLHSTIEAFGFGKATGVDLPSENAGLLRPLDRWSALSPAYISFGQGLSITALQLNNAFAAIANGGRLLEPHIVASVGAPPEERRREVVGLPISPSSVRQIRSMLESVVIEGTAKAAGLDGYRVAGKTGTAQKAIGGGYAKDRYIASFVGFAPVRDPSLVMTVVIDEPWPRYHGGEVAAPAFKAIAAQSLLYLGVRPDLERSDPPPTLLAERGDPPESVPIPDRQIQPAGTIPDFAGLSAREAVLLSSDLGVELRFTGHGLVESQTPEPGTPLELVSDGLHLVLSPRRLASVRSGQRTEGAL
ncbi:MAG: penicillin-binding protein [Acidobacteriota bacterium]